MKVKVIHNQNNAFMGEKSYARSYPHYPPKCETCFT